MITNLLASIVVTLVTNTSERFPTHIEAQPCPDGIANCAVFHGKEVPDPNPDKKWVKTITKEVTKLTFVYGDKSFTIDVAEKPLTDEEEEFEIVREPRWKSMKRMSAAGVIFTNSISYFDLIPTNQAPPFPQPPR